MTPQERQLVIDLFDRLATLENAPRDPDAERAIMDGLRRAPNAAYALVQTVLVQDEALRRAEAQIREMKGLDEPAARPTGFLDGMRDTLLGRHETSGRGSVPSVRPGIPPQAAIAERPDPWAHAIPSPQQGQVGAGGSFLGTAAAAAAGMVGGSLLLGGIRSMMGSPFGPHGAAAASEGSRLASPGEASGDSDLARSAGIDDIGRASGASSGESRRFSAFDDTATNDGDTDQHEQSFDDPGDIGSDAGGDDLA
jgi:hypothetical protein